MADFTFTSPEGKSYTVSGPDGSTKEEAFGILQQQLGAKIKAQPSVMDNYDADPRVDAAKGAGSGLVEGLIGGTVGLPGDLSNLAGKGIDSALRFFSPDTADAFQKFGANSGISNALDKTTTPALVKDLGADYQPGTELGKFIKAGVGGAASMASGGVEGLPARLAGGAAIGGASQQADRFGGPVAGAGVDAATMALMTAIRGHTPRNVRTAQDLINDVPAGGLDIARQKADVAAATLGTPTLLTQGMGNQGGMSALTQEIMKDPSAGAVLRRVLERQAPVGQDKINDLIDSLSKRPNDQSTANSVLDAGAAAVKEPELARTAAVAPDYAAAKSDMLPANDVLKLSSDIRQINDTHNLRGSPAGDAVDKYAKRVDKLSADGTNPVPVLTLDNLAKAAQKSASPGEMATGAEKARAIGHAKVAEVITNATTGQSSNLAAAKAKYAADSVANVDPMQQSSMTSMFPVADRVSGKGNFDNMTSIFDAKGSDRSKDIEFVAQNLLQHDPEAFPSIAKKWMEGAQGKANQLVEGRPNPDAMNSFVTQIAGEQGSNQRENFRATMRGVAQSQGANPQTVQQGAENLMDALEVASRERQGLGKIDTGEVSREAGANLASTIMKSSFFQPARQPGYAIERVLQRKTYAAIADALTSPDGVAKLQEIAAFKPGDTRTKAIVQGLMQGNGLLESME